MIFIRFDFLKYCLVIMFALQCFAGFSQGVPQSIDLNTIEKVEAAIERKERLQEAQQQLVLIKAQAQQAHDDVLIARSLYNLMRLKDQRTEDTLYFRNSAFIDTLLADGKASPKLKSIMHLMRARRLTTFDNGSKRFNYAAYKTKKLNPDYAAFSREQRDSLAVADLKAALRYDKPGGKQVLWLSSNPDVFLFDPKFEDIVLAENINRLIAKANFNFAATQSTANLLAMPSAAFRSRLQLIADSVKSNPNVLAVYQQWLVFNKADGGISSFIESLARKYIYLSSNTDSLSKQHYIKYLEEGIASDYLPLKAHAIYQLCLIWNEDGNKYVSFDDRYNYSPTPRFAIQYQFLPAKALQLYQDNLPLMEKFPLFNNVLDMMAQQIKQKGMRIEMDDQHLPGTDIPIKVIYKNTAALHYRIVKINASEPAGKARVEPTQELLNRLIIAEGSFILPSPADYNRHAVYLKLAKLETGRYRLLFSDAPLAISSDDFNNLVFEVTTITAINTDEKVFVLNRKTGFPLAGATIKAFRKKLPAVKRIATTTGLNGAIDIPEDAADSLSISYKGDTTAYRLSIQKNNLGDDVYTKDEYDNITEFYEDKLHMEIFTDRSIYRPGQTMHYKIIFLANNPNTAETMLFTSKNVGSRIFNKMLKKLAEDGDDTITISDPFNKTIASAKITINDFGSFAGSFVIPKNAATGSWNIEGGPDTDGYNRGDFEVEEYKRPTIELSVEKPKKMLMPGQPFVIKFKLRSLSGATPANTPINYTVERSGRIPSATSRVENYYRDYAATELLRKKGYTDDKGELSVSINDSLIVLARLTDAEVWDYTYTIKATAIEATGESTDVSQSIKISSRPVKISMPVNKTYDRLDLPAFKINTTADFEGAVGRKVNIKLYETANPDGGKVNLKFVDQWYYNKADWNAWFPDRAEGPAEKAADEKILLLDTVINTADFENLALRKELIKEGYYHILAQTQEGGRVIGQSTYNFNVFDSKASTAPADDVDYLPFNSLKPGEWLSWYTSGNKENYAIYQVLYAANSKKVALKSIYETATEKPGIRLWRYHIPANATGELVVNKIIVADNKIEVLEKRIYITGPAVQSPDIIVEKYRKVMAPGAQETITLSVKTKSDNIAAEVMTTLYDAALDKLEEHRWQLPRESSLHSYYFRTNWDRSLTGNLLVGNYADKAEPFNIASLRAGTPGASASLQGRVAGLSISSAGGLNEVVVVGYGTQRRMEMTGAISTVNIRGASTLMDYAQPLIIIDGVVFSGDLKTISMAAITQAMVLKGADASAFYGSRAAQGVLIISTKGPIIFPAAEEPVVKIRKNFNESAFFFPQIHAGPDGFYTFSFTMPETATEWNWKIFAHTRKAKFSYLEKKLQTQLNLMVQPNMPRLLYQGDKIKLQSRVTNLDTLAIQGKATCKIEDAVTGEDITALLTANSVLPFSITKKSSGTVAFSLHVPAVLLNPLKIIITATAGGTGDAEEHTIPVLSTKIFTRQTQAINLSSQPTITLPIVKLPADAVPYGVGLSINQKPQASLINALPWLANYSFDCAEQTFNKLRALTTGLFIMQKDTSAQKAFEKVSAAVKSNTPGAEPLPDKMAEEAMPWLGLSNYTARSQKQLYGLFDTVSSKKTIIKHLEKLYKFQQPDGGLAWFEGGQTNDYISSYVLAGFGQLKQMGWLAQKGYTNQQGSFIDDLLNYQDNLLAKPSPSKSADLYQLYALSYWLDEHTLSANALQKVNALLNTGWADADNKSMARAALLIISTYRFTKPGDALRRKAETQLENIRQLAIQDDTNGLRWKDIADNEELNSSEEETMALLAEAFNLSGKYPEVQAGIVKWLLTAKQEEHWQTTKATAAAVNMLQKQNGSVIGERKALSAQLNGKQLSVSDGLLDGVPLAVVTSKQLPQSVTVQKQGMAVTGNISWYYFAEPANLDTMNKAVKISKQFFRYADDKNWTSLNANNILKQGDRIQVRLTIETISRLKFAHISDPRSAAFEPKESSSGYQYNGGFGYYQSIRDTGLDIFAEAIPKGISEVVYELVVAHGGEFTSGPAKLQCMYQPAIAAYSNATKIKTD